MRLFIAIDFSAAVKEQLMDTINKLKYYAVRGSFTHRDNLHVTLAFIGETQRQSDIRKVMEQAAVSPFELVLEGCGRFKRGDGDLCWTGIKPCGGLAALQRGLCDGLIQNGFELDRREFKPHITLGRRVILREGFDIEAFSRDVPLIAVSVGKISLMKSERINGRIIYTEIYANRLEG